MNIIYMGSFNKAICAAVAAFKDIKVTGLILDPSLDLENRRKTIDFWLQYDVHEISFSEEEIKKVDGILVNGYRQIIKSDLLKKYLFINIHAGNLPKWRGMSANSWAILNGDFNLAYTIHRVTEELDAGPIFHKYEYEIEEFEKYGDARIKLESMLLDDFENILKDILLGKNKGIVQEGEYIYCNSFKKQDGYITDWNISTEDIINKFKVFGAPYGSGLFLKRKEEWYEILELRRDNNFAESFLVPGAIVYKNQKGVWIKTKDTAVIIKSLRDNNGNIIAANNILNIGVRL